jgi:Kef-type K+ transport system membrane component KefB
VFESPFHELGGLLLVSAGVAYLGMRLRQPLVVSFIAAGIIAGPAALDWVRSRDQIDLLAQIGIALLLFVVGLKLDVRLIRSVGSVALATGLGQVAFTSIIGFGLCLALGLGAMEATYVAVALTFSSTIIIVKLLTDKREIDSLHGRIAIAFLIVQDVVVVLAMIVLVGLSSSQQADAGVLDAVWALVRGFGLFGLLLLATWFVLPRAIARLTGSAEILVLFAVAWAVTAAGASEYLGFGKELGALGAGVTLASIPQREILVSRLAGLRDFLLLFFFIQLGARLELDLLAGQLGAALVLSLFVLVGNPLIVMVIMGVLGYRSRTSFLAGLTVAQISEFSLVLGALGVSIGHLSPSGLGLITMVGLITIAASTYMILYSHPLYERLSRWLVVFERPVAFAEQAGPTSVESAGIVLVGIGRHGRHLADELRARGWSVLGVDFDPEEVQKWRQRGHPACLGDATDPELPLSLPLAGAEWVVSTLPELDANLGLLRALRDHGFHGRVALGARNARGATRLAAAGADAVLYPFEDAARRGAEVLGEPSAQREPA